MLPVYLIFYCVIGLHFISIYSSVPDRLITHFNQFGDPDRWLTREAFAWYHWGFIVSLSGLFGILALAVKHMPPRRLPIPNKDYWLTPERAQQSIERLVDSLVLMGLIAGGAVAMMDHQIMKAAIKGARASDLEGMGNVLYWAAGLFTLICLRLMLKFRKPVDFALRPQAPPRKAPPKEPPKDPPAT